jgi:carbonic anhydrase
MLGTREIALFHHTKCGMSTCTSHGIRQKAKETLTNADSVNEVDFLEFSDLEDSVKSDVEWLKVHPLILPETVITGWVYEVETGQVSENSISTASKTLILPSDP